MNEDGRIEGFILKFEALYEFIARVVGFGGSLLLAVHHPGRSELHRVA